MQVEILDEREISPETLKPEAEPEALALIEELGLKLQVDNGSKHRQGYPSPTKDQAFVLMTVFGQATRLKDYDAGVIPLRVLKEIRSYKAEHPGHMLFIRHDVPSVVKDPVLMAYTGEHDWMWNQDCSGSAFRMIARWGDALEPWDVLMIKAKRLMAIKAKEALHGIIAEAETALAKIDKTGEWGRASVPSLHGIQ